MFINCSLLILVALGVGVFLCPLTLFKSKPAPVDFSELSKVVKRLCDELLKKLIYLITRNKVLKKCRRC